MFLGVFKLIGVSAVCIGSFSQNSRVFLGFFVSVLRLFQGCVSWLFCALKVFYGYFKIV